MGTVTVTIKTEVPAASAKAVKDLEGGFKSLTQVTTNFKDNVGDAFSVLKGALGASAIQTGLHAITEGAKELFQVLLVAGVASASAGALATEKLNTQMAVAGTFSAAAATEYERFAKTVQRTTTVQDDQATSLLSLAQVYRKGTDESEKLVQASIELSAVTGK